MALASAADCRSRHRHRFEAWNGAAAFVKSATDPEGARDLSREAQVLDLLASRLPKAAAFVPAPIGWDAENATLRTEAITAVDLAERTRAAGFLDPTVTRELGTALARLHEHGRAVVADVPGPAQSGPVGVHRPGPADMRGLSAGALEVLVLLQSSTRLCGHLDRLCRPPPTNTLIHGDLRLENVLVARDSGIRLVDWEFSGSGEAVWDVAQATASILSAWLVSVPQVPAVPPGQLLDEAALPLVAVRPGLIALWTAYWGADDAAIEAARRRCLELTAVRLVQIAVEIAGDTEDLRATSVTHLQLAENLLERPAALCHRLLGVALADD
jgi:hypothetical protein